jgi:hypothetical protein
MSFLSKLASQLAGGILADKGAATKIANTGILGSLPKSIAQSQMATASIPSQSFTNNYQNPMLNRVAPTPQMQMPMQQQPAFNPQQQAAMNTMRFGGNRPQQQYTPPQMIPMQPPIMPSQMQGGSIVPQINNGGPAMSGAPWNIQRRFT